MLNELIRFQENQVLTLHEEIMKKKMLLAAKQAALKGWFVFTHRENLKWDLKRLYETDAFQSFTRAAEEANRKLDETPEIMRYTRRMDVAVNRLNLLYTLRYMIGFSEFECWYQEESNQSLKEYLEPGPALFREGQFAVPVNAAAVENYINSIVEEMKELIENRVSLNHGNYRSILKNVLTDTDEIWDVWNPQPCREESCWIERWYYECRQAAYDLKEYPGLAALVLATDLTKWEEYYLY